MRDINDLVWKKKSSVFLEYSMLFAIRLIETLAAGFAPSVIGIIMLLFDTKPQVLTFFSWLSFIIFSVMNWFFWMRYAKRRTKRTEFYIINGASYLLYVLLSVISFKFTDPLMYTIVFSNLRALEIFAPSTFLSLVYSHVFLVVLMVVCNFFSRSYYTRLMKKLAENGADPIEMDVWGKITPKHKNKDIKLLSVDEMDAEMEREKVEAARVYEAASRDIPESVWDAKLIKGKGEYVDKVIPENPDHDIDEGDYDYEKEREYNPNEDYDADSLWNTEIYKGRTDGDVPIRNYTEDDYKPDAENNDNLNMPDSLWNTDMHQGRGKSISFTSEDDGYETYYDRVSRDNEKYDENLWDSEMYQGRKK